MPKLLRELLVSAGGSLIASAVIWLVVTLFG
jgi:hypothetical protein